MTTRSYKQKIVKTEDRTNTRSYISPGHRCYWPVTCPCSYDIASMLVRYCLYARTVLPLCSYAIPSMLVRYWLNDRTIWPEYCPHTLSSHSHRRNWPVTCPCSYGIASMTVQYLAANIAQRISGTDISERCAIVSNRYNIAATKTISKTKNKNKIKIKNKNKN